MRMSSFSKNVVKFRRENSQILERQFEIEIEIERDEENQFWRENGQILERQFEHKGRDESVSGVRIVNSFAPNLCNVKVDCSFNGNNFPTL